MYMQKPRYYSKTNHSEPFDLQRTLVFKKGIFWSKRFLIEPYPSTNTNPVFKECNYRNNFRTVWLSEMMWNNSTDLMSICNVIQRSGEGKARSSVLWQVSDIKKRSSLGLGTQDRIWIDLFQRQLPLKIECRNSEGDSVTQQPFYTYSHAKRLSPPIKLSTTSFS